MKQIPFFFITVHKNFAPVSCEELKNFKSTRKHRKWDNIHTTIGLQAPQVRCKSNTTLIFVELFFAETRKTGLGFLSRTESLHTAHPSKDFSSISNYCEGGGGWKLSAKKRILVLS